MRNRSPAHLAEAKFEAAKRMRRRQVDNFCDNTLKFVISICICAESGGEVHQNVSQRVTHVNFYSDVTCDRNKRGIIFFKHHQTQLSTQPFSSRSLELARNS